MLVSRVRNSLPLVESKCRPYRPSVTTVTSVTPNPRSRDSAFGPASPASRAGPVMLPRYGCLWLANR